MENIVNMKIESCYGELTEIIVCQIVLVFFVLVLFLFLFLFLFWQKWARERITPDLQAISKCSFHFHSNAWSIFWTEVVFFKQMRNTSVLFMLHHTSHATSYIFVIQLGHVFKNKCWFCESAFAISSLTHLKKAHFSNLRLFFLIQLMVS